PGLKDERQFQCRTDCGRSAQTYEHAQHASERAHHDGFDEELQKHVALAGADGEPDSDLARSLGHRHQHDVHDADSSDKQAHRRDGREKCREDQSHCRDDLRNLLEIFDVEIVDLAWNDVPGLAHQALDQILYMGHVLRAVDQNPDDVHFGVARDLALNGLQGHQHKLIHVLTECAHAFRLENPDDFAGDLVDADALTDGHLVAEQFAPIGLTDDAHRLARQGFGRRELASCNKRPIAALHIVIARAVDL